MTAARPAHPIKVYSSSISGHSHRVRLFLALLELKLSRSTSLQKPSASPSSCAATPSARCR